MLNRFESTKPRRKGPFPYFSRKKRENHQTSFKLVLLFRVACAALGDYLQKARRVAARLRGGGAFGVGPGSAACSPEIGSAARAGTINPSNLFTAATATAPKEQGAAPCPVQLFGALKCLFYKTRDPSSCFLWLPSKYPPSKLSTILANSPMASQIAPKQAGGISPAAHLLKQERPHATSGADSNPMILMSNVDPN